MLDQVEGRQEEWLGTELRELMLAAVETVGLHKECYIRLLTRYGRNWHDREIIPKPGKHQSWYHKRLLLGVKSVA